MDLAREVINELKAKNLNGATITNVEYSPTETRISFTIQGIEVFFTARNAEEYAITSMTYQGNVFNDPSVLSQYDAWVKYVLTEVYPTIESKRIEAAEVAYKANIQTLQPDEHAVVGKAGNLSAERLDEAESRGRKEGFKSAKKTHVKEIAALKKKYHTIIAITVVVLIATFIGFWIFTGTERGANTFPSMVRPAIGVHQATPMPLDEE